MDVPVRAGDVIGDAYRVERVIGSGGMAVVVAAIHLYEPRRVAIKVLMRRAARHAEVLKRFEREQRLVQELESEHVTKSFGSGVHKGAPYMVMEYLQGSDLSEVLKTQGALPIDTALEYVLQACEAVAEAHGKGIIHRDLKPGNLFLTHRVDGSPCIKVLDFGVAKVADPQGGTGELTKTTAVFGSPFYMSPEQMISAKEVTVATDIWALGVILYELIAESIPFAAKTPEKVCTRVLHDAPTPLTQHRPDVPAALDQVVVRCLQRRPDQRYPDVAALAEALAACAPATMRGSAARAAAYLGRASRVPVPVDMSPKPARDPMEAPDVPTIYLTREDASRSRWKAGAIGVALFAAGVGVGMVARPVLRPDRDTAVQSALACHSTTPSAPTVAPADPVASSDRPIMDLDEDVDRRPKDAPKRRSARSDTPSVSSLMAAYDAVVAEGSASATAKPAPPRKTNRPQTSGASAVTNPYDEPTKGSAGE